MTNNLMIHNLDPNTARRFRVLAAEKGLTQADTLEWLLTQVKTDVDGKAPAAVNGTNPAN